MASDIKVEVEIPDWKRYEKQLKRFPDRLKRAQRNAMIQSTRLMQTLLRRKSNKKTGRLARGWVIERNTPVEGKIVNRVPYAVYVNEGTSPHVILPRRRSALRFVKRGRVIFAKKVHHPGTKAYNITGKAWKEAQPRISKIYRKALEEEVNQL
jgi:hypothetical protein